MTRRATILRAIGCPHLELARGDGYQYWVYDRPATAERPALYETHTEPVFALNHCTNDWWIDSGTRFVAQLEATEAQRARFEMPTMTGGAR